MVLRLCVLSPPSLANGRRGRGTLTQGASVHRWIVCGSRHLGEGDRLDVERGLCWVAELVGMPRVILHGAARGADSLAQQWAEALDVRTEPHPADWAKYGRAAGPLRNQAMADRLRGSSLALCIAMPLVGEDNRGTWDMARRAGQAGANVIVLPVRREEDSK